MKKVIKYLPAIAFALCVAGAILERFEFSGIAAILLLGYIGFNFFNKK